MSNTFKTCIIVLVVFSLGTLIGYSEGKDEGISIGKSLSSGKPYDCGYSEITGFVLCNIKGE